MTNSANGTVLCSLSELSVIRLSGADTVQFLQGQVTNDVTKLGADLMIAGYCSPKGRLIATFRLFAHDDAVCAIVPTEQVAALVKRLKMFVLRSKVTVEVLEDVRVIGLVGQLPDEVAGSRVFAQSDADVQTRIAAALPAGRGLCVVPAAQCAEMTLNDSTLYWTAAIAAGDPWIVEATREAFVPQGINLELVGGVSFRKGCYTGQEVVSRVEHIGKTPRRAFLLAFNNESTLSAGQDLVTDDGRIVGIVVMATSYAGRTLALVQCETAAMDALTGSIGDQPLTRLPLPYTFERA